MYQKDISSGSAGVMALAAFLFCLTLAGMCGGRKRANGISCVVITYFYVTMFTLIVLVFMAITNLITQTGLNVSLLFAVWVVRCIRSLRVCPRRRLWTVIGTFSKRH